MNNNTPHHVVDLIDSIIEVEGNEFTDHPHDKGGPTKFGITEREARAGGYQNDMRYLPREFAFQHYLQEDWLRPKFNLVHKISESIAFELADSAVNMGSHQAVLFLQRALNALNMMDRQNKLLFGDDLEVDGSIGPATLARLDEALETIGPRAGQIIYGMQNAQQATFYMNLSLTRKKQRTFFKGWVEKRVGDQMKTFWGAPSSFDVTGMIAAHDSTKDKSKPLKSSQQCPILSELDQSPKSAGEYLRKYPSQIISAGLYYFRVHNGNLESKVTGGAQWVKTTPTAIDNVTDYRVV